MNTQTIYRVNALYPSIQGEGKHTGVPVVFLRLQGCAVGCPWCDTKETWSNAPAEHRVNSLAELRGASAHAWTEATATEIAAHIRARWPKLRRVVVTGGEPLEQDCTLLTCALSQRGLRCHLETSGTVWPPTGVWDWVCVSPKIGMPGGKSVDDQALIQADEVKWVVGKEEDLYRLAQLLMKHPKLNADTHISLQPISQSPSATALCIEACLRHGWSLSVQVHKALGLP